MIRFRGVSVLLILVSMFGWLGSGQVRAEAKPNVIMIYADDLGYGDVQCYNPERGKIPTPNIDRLAAEGMRFTDAHSSSGVCSPSRYAILTGRYHWRTSLQQGIVGTWGAPLIAPDRVTVASLLKAAGYRTACIGKWHLGWDWPIDEGARKLFLGSNKEDLPVTAEHLAAWGKTFSREISGGPTTRGFDSYFGTDVPNWPPFCFIENNRTVGMPTVFLPARLFKNNQASVQGPALRDWTLEPILPALGDRAVDYIEQAASGTAPWFVYMPLTAPHTPLAVNQEWSGKSGLGMYGDFVMETDAVIGRVLRAIEKSGQKENTLVFFTSDNGCAPYIGVKELEAQGHYPSGPLRGYKSDAWEGGHRVPLIVRWPGRIQAGTTCDQLVHQTDIIATVADYLGLRLEENAGEDSFSLVPLLKGGQTPVRTSSVSHSSKGLPAIRLGEWKLIFGKGSGGWAQGEDDHPAQLYNLKEDLGETKNLYAERPELVARLTKLMEETVTNGRSTPGPKQDNDVDVKWQRFLGKK